MVSHMKTTINLPDGLAEEAKKCATKRGCTFTALVVEGLHRVLQESPPAPRSPLPTWGNKGDRVLVDLEDKEALWEILDADGWK